MQGKFVLCAAVLCVCVFVLGVQGATTYGESEYQSFFSAWQHTHAKAYTSDEFVKRYSNFKKMLDFITSHNAAGHSFTVGLNEFSDLTNEEFRKLLLNPVPAIPADANLPQHTDGGRAPRAATVDWRTSGVVQAIKNQGQCGSCWSFATASTIESITKISTGVLPSLSEQNLVDCVTSSSGCNGGSPYYAMKYVISNNGIDTSASYPYKGVNGNCSYNPANSGATITGVTQVTKNSESALLSAVNQQPVVVAIDASLPSFQSYKSGTYNDAACSSTTLNHAVVAIGYGTDNGTDYWLVRNSWGTNWGTQGYFQLARNANNKCGVAASAVYPTKTASASATSAKSSTTATTAKASTTGSAATSVKSSTSTTAKSSSTGKSSTTSKW